MAIIFISWNEHSILTKSKTNRTIGQCNNLKWSYVLSLSSYTSQYDFFIFFFSPKTTTITKKLCIGSIWLSANSVLLCTTWVLLFPLVCLADDVVLLCRFIRSVTKYSLINRFRNGFDLGSNSLRYSLFVASDVRQKTGKQQKNRIFVVEYINVFFFWVFLLPCCKTLTYNKCSILCSPLTAFSILLSSSLSLSPSPLLLTPSTFLITSATSASLTFRCRLG